MKVGVITLMTALLFALPALAGDPCTGPDTDSDGYPDICDNCDALANPSQQDDDSDGYGDMCDCDHDNSNYCDGTDFLLFAGAFGQTVPPAAPPVDQDDSLYVDGTDFLLFAAGFGQPPGSACSPTHTKGNPCPGPNP